MAAELLPITQAMYTQGQQELVHPRYAFPRRETWIRLVYFPAKNESVTEFISPENLAPVVVIDTCWVPTFRVLRNTNQSTDLRTTVPIFDGWRCLNPIVAEEEMPGMSQSEEMALLVRHVREAIADLPEYGEIEVHPLLPEHGEGGIMFRIYLPEYPGKQLQAALRQHHLEFAAKQPEGLRGCFQRILANTRRRLAAEGMPV